MCHYNPSRHITCTMRAIRSLGPRHTTRLRPFASEPLCNATHTPCSTKCFIHKAKTSLTSQKNSFPLRLQNHEIQDTSSELLISPVSSVFLRQLLPNRPDRGDLSDIPHQTRCTGVPLTLTNARSYPLTEIHAPASPRQAFSGVP